MSCSSLLSPLRGLDLMSVLRVKLRFDADFLTVFLKIEDAATHCAIPSSFQLFISETPHMSSAGLWLVLNL